MTPDLWGKIGDVIFFLFEGGTRDKHGEIDIFDSRGLDAFVKEC